MDVRMTPETRAALETDRTLRLLCSLKFDLSSRSSKSVIAWADDLMKGIATAVLNPAQRETVPVSTQLIMIQLRDRRDQILISSDITLGDAVQDQHDPAVERPIYEVQRIAKAYHIYRSRKMDTVVVDEFKRRRQRDRGPLPIFIDFKRPPVYEDGRRVGHTENGKIVFEEDVFQEAGSGAHDCRDADTETAGGETNRSDPSSMAGDSTGSDNGVQSKPELDGGMQETMKARSGGEELPGFKL